MSDTLAERMKRIVQQSQQIKKSTDEGRLPSGLEKYATESPEEAAEFLAFSNRIADGTLKIQMDKDGKGFTIGK